VVFSRFGVMFFDDPVAAFRNLLRALRPGGRLAFVCWQAGPLNPLMAVPMAAALQHMPMPSPPAPNAPGPFAFADAGRVRSILEQAGFAAIAIEPRERDLAVAAGADLGGTVDFLLQLGPLGSALREADPSLRDRVAAAVREAIAPFAAPGGGVRLGSAFTVVRATRP
ncbi:MAG: class I SAM-dependent methyltransferase, partial [Alphaproteobacteria bacterium]